MKLFLAFEDCGADSKVEAEINHGVTKSREGFSDSGKAPVFGGVLIKARRAGKQEPRSSTRKVQKRA